MKLILKLVVMVTLLQNVHSRFDSRFGRLPDKCLDSHNKDSPSTDTEQYPECEEWQDLSCCTITDTQFIHEIGPSGFVYTASVCGEFSFNCTKYQKAVACWFYCEPMLVNFRHENLTHINYQAPICGQYCDDWFDACKDDKTCVEDWREGFLDPDTRNCPANGSTCITYAEMYADGEGLCNSMFSNSLKYEASNKDCMVMMFDGKNPNIHGDPYGRKNKAITVTCSLVTNLVCLWLSSHIL